MASEEELPCDVTRVDTRSFDDFPLEIIALIADFVYNFHDLARMSLVSHHVRHGVLLSYQWIIVREVVEAIGGDVEAQRRYLHDRIRCAEFAYKKGLLRTIRVLNLSRKEVFDSNAGHIIAEYGQLDVLKYLCATYALTVAGVMTPDLDVGIAVMHGQIELLKYLHSSGMAIPTRVLNDACLYGRLEVLKWLHTDIGFTAEDVRRLGDRPQTIAVMSSDRDCTAYRFGYGLTQDDARRVLRRYSSPEIVRILSEVFELELD